MKLGTAAGWGMAGMLAFAAAQAREPACGADDVSCWYLVGGAGEAPRRVAYLARHAGTAADGGGPAVDLVQVLEAADAAHPYVLWRLRVDCGASALRTEHAWRARRDGILDRQPVQAGDSPPLVPASHEGTVALPFACDEDVARGRSSEHPALFVGNAYRAPDAVSGFRQAFWEEGPTAP